MRRMRWSVGVAITGVLAVSMGSASAETQTFRDQRGEVSASVDIHRVKVINGSASTHRVKVVVTQRRLKGGDEIDVWIDTKRANPGPEYRAGVKANTNALGLLMVRRWGSPGQVVACPRFRATSDQFRPGNWTRISIPRRCLADPGAIRVSARVRRHAADGWVRDWAPKRHVFYDWVAETP
jgi:hypothetical protein